MKTPNPSRFNTNKAAGTCDMRLPQAALAYRQSQTYRPGQGQRQVSLVTAKALGAFNITSWLYIDKAGTQRVQTNPNVRMAELIQQFGPAETLDAELGLHSEGIAAQWFIDNYSTWSEVKQIFTERIPCYRCSMTLKNSMFKDVPVFYYYDGNTLLLDNTARILKTCYGLP